MKRVSLFKVPGLSVERIGKVDSYYDITFFNYFNFSYFTGVRVFKLNLLNNWMFYPQRKKERSWVLFTLPVKKERVFIVASVSDPNAPFVEGQRLTEMEANAIQKHFGNVVQIDAE